MNCWFFMVNVGKYTSSMDPVGLFLPMSSCEGWSHPKLGEGTHEVILCWSMRIEIRNLYNLGMQVRNFQDAIVTTRIVILMLYMFSMGNPELASKRIPNWHPNDPLEQVTNLDQDRSCMEMSGYALECSFFFVSYAASVTNRNSL